MYFKQKASGTGLEEKDGVALAMALCLACIFSGCRSGDAGHLSGENQRFVVERVSVGVSGPSDGMDGAAEALFKLDRATGMVWRYDGDSFQEVRVEDPIVPPFYVRMHPSRETDRDCRYEMRIWIPEIDLRNETLADVLSFLEREYSAHADESFKRQSPHLPVALAVTNLAADVRITYSGRKVPLDEMIENVAALANLRVEYTPAAVLLVPRDYPLEMLIHTYDVEPSLGAMVSNWTNFFGRLGVEWPQGSFARQVPQTGQLVVRNTRRQLRAFEDLLATMNVPVGQDCHFEFFCHDQHLYLLESLAGQVWRYEANWSETNNRVAKAESFKPVRDVSLLYKMHHSAR